MNSHRLVALFLLSIFVLLSAVPAEARRERLDLRQVSIDLPGPPAAIVAADVDGDGRRDLAVVVAFTEWDQIGIEEQTTMDDIEGVVEVMTIVPALFDRRELHLFRADEDGSWQRAAPPLPIDTSVLSLFAGPAGHPLVVLTDEGLSDVRLTGGTLGFSPFLEEEPLLARSRTFVAKLDLVHDLDQDGRADLLYPTRDGLNVYLAREEELHAETVLPWPPEPARTASHHRHFPIPEVRDVTGDGLPDLLMPHDRAYWEHFHLFRSRGAGAFHPIETPLGPFDPETWKHRFEEAEAEEQEQGQEQEQGTTPARQRVVHFGDLDGDGIGEYATEESLATEEGGMRKEMREAKRPPYRFRIHPTSGDGVKNSQIVQDFEVLGYAFIDESDDEMALPGGFRDLNGDGRQDLLTLTLDFSLFQAVRVVATKSLSIGLDFNIFCQQDDGTFREVEGLDLSGKFKINLNQARIGQLSQFSGDFDGDGRADFVQIGRGKEVTIHRGGADCNYPTTPDLSIRLNDEPRDLALVRIEDFDGDEHSDLLVIQPQEADEAGLTPPVRLDFYLSGEFP